MSNAGYLNGALLFTREPDEASTYYEWLLELTQSDAYETALESVGVSAVLTPSQDVESPAGWVPVFVVEDVDDALARVAGMGVTARSDLMQGSDIRIVVNSAGIWTGLVNADSDEARLSQPREMNCDYCALDVRVATTTLTQLLGVHSLEIVNDLYNMNVLHSDNNLTCGVLQMSGIEALAARPYWVTYFEVADIAKVTMRAVESGSRIVIPPAKSPFNQYAVFRDPWGNIFGLSQLDAQPSENEISVQLSDGTHSTLGDTLNIRT